MSDTGNPSGYPVTGVAYGGQPYAHPGGGGGVPLSGQKDYKPVEPPKLPPTPTYWTLLRNYRVDSVMRAVPIVITDKAKLVDLTKEEDLANFIIALQWCMKTDRESDPGAHFITHIARVGDTYFIYRRDYVDLQHFFSYKLYFSYEFETLGILDTSSSSNGVMVLRNYGNGLWVKRTTNVPRLLAFFEIEDGGSVLIYAPFTNLFFRAEDYYLGDSDGYTREFSPLTPFNWKESAYAGYLSYLISKGYPIVADVYPLRVSYSYYLRSGNLVLIDEYEDAEAENSRLLGLPTETYFSGLVDKYYNNYSHGETYYYTDLPYSRLYYYSYYRRLFPAEAIGRYTLNVGNISLQLPQTKLICVVDALARAPLRSMIERKPFLPLSEQITPTARFRVPCNIQRKPFFALREQISARAQTSLHINILPFFRLIHQIQRQPQFQLTEFIVPLYTPAYFRLKLEIVGGAKTSINQNINRKFFIPVISRVSSKCYFQINENLSRLPFFTLIQKHISHPRLRLITRLKAPPPRFRIDITLYSQCRHPLRIRCWRYERPIRNFDYYRYYGITIRS